MSPTPNQRKFTLELLTEWRKLGLPFEGETVVLAVSGGVDSCALALGISDLRDRKKLKNEFVVAHFDHGLREQDSQKDSDLVRDLSERLGFNFFEGKAAASLFRSRSNLEEKARTARYKFLGKTAEKVKAKYVLTAHTRNDQAETLLLNLIRGAGIDGLSGMAPVREFGTEGNRSGQRRSDDGEQILLARPMLAWALRELNRDFCSDCGITPREDPMNEDPAFSRVRIRNEVIPLLEDLNPKIIETLASTADTLREEGDILSVNTERLTKALSETQGESLGVELLSQMPDELAVSTVRRWIALQKGSLRGVSRKHIISVVELAKSRKSGKFAELPGSSRIVKQKGRLCFEDVKVEK